ncbi:hypothetical protein Pd630_LPD04340 [Rhodococcus opacus PD630]|jgi:hypothetical protein|nr:hypothetical protein Pd630_LPD04340 [Rhodococcus opacus PD630]
MPVVTGPGGSSPPPASVRRPVAPKAKRLQHQAEHKEGFHDRRT